MKKNCWKTLLSLCLLALCGASVSWFLAHPVAGQEAAPSVLHGAAAIERLRQTGQYASLRSALQQAQLSVSQVADSPLGRAAWHAPNAAAGYDAYVTETGVSLALNDAALVSLSLHSIGYGNALQVVGSGQVSGDQQSITITRDNLHEWFVNGADGLEHGFTLQEPPNGAGGRQADVPVRLLLQVSEGWQARADEDGQHVTLRNTNGQAVEYGKLIVRDKLGRKIPAKLTVADEQVVIEVEDHNALYPLLIDPIFALPQKLVAADGENDDQFGYAVALNGNTAAVGAWQDTVTRTKQGSVYVFVRNGAVWSQQARLTANDASVGALLGASVALSGDTLVAGAFGDDGERGAAYVFTRSGTGSNITWTQQQKLTAQDSAVHDWFGHAVALSGDTVAVSALLDDESRGGVYVFTRSGTIWAQQQKLSADKHAAGAYFGAAVALDGDTLLAGAPHDTVDGKLAQGAAYVFTRSGAVWTQRSRLTAALGQAQDRFGNAVALSGETLAVGAAAAANGTNANQGAAYVFKFNGAAWAQQARLIAADGKAGDTFGHQVALSGDTLVVNSLGSAKAYVFARSGATWTQQTRLLNSSGKSSDGFGGSLALSGDTVLVGAERSDAAVTNQGAVQVFVLRDNRHAEQQKLFANDGAAWDSFGNAVTLSGDTLAIGALSDDSPGKAEHGSVYVFVRNSAAQPAWTFQQKLIANDGAANDYFGYAVALDGDTLAVGAYRHDNGAQTDQGAVYVFTRNGARWAFQQKLTGNDSTAGDNFGGALALRGDMLVVGARNYDNGTGSPQGAAYVFRRSGTNWLPSQKLTAFDAQRYDGFGEAVAFGDDTLAVGAPYGDSGTNSNQGAVYVFARNGTTWAFQQKLTAPDGAREELFGNAVALSGDTLAIGAVFDSTGAIGEHGSAYVFRRGGTVWSFRQKLLPDDGENEGHFGVAVALSEDLLAVGSHWATIGTNPTQGAVYVYAATRDNWSFQQKLTASDGAGNDFLGYAVALSGDTLVAGAVADTIGTTFHQGSAYVFVSPRCTALTLAPTTLPGGVMGTSYNQTITVSGDAGTYQFAVSAGALPPGLSLAQHGLLAGTPATAGTYRFTITATNGQSLCAGSQSYTLTITPPNNTRTVALVSAASYQPGIAPESIVAAFGVQLAQQTQSATSLPLPTTLAGVSVRVRDSQGVERAAPLFFVSPGQINFQMPAGTATGTATVIVSTGATGQVEIKRTAAGLFAANADGQGVPAAVGLRVKANGAQSYEAVAQLNGTRFSPLPIELGPTGEQVFLVLYGTGIRFKQTITASIGGVEANVLFTGAVAGLAGLDQVNLALPRALIGRGEIEVVLRVDGVNANTVRINVR
jgi:uncharacterized protein (TIGR03437 family)